jgi:hypothetical protein
MEKIKSTNPWLEHVMQEYKANPGSKFKDALKNAKSTYKKTPKEVKVKKVRIVEEGEIVKLNPWMVHIEKWKNEHPDWKSTMSYKQVLQTCKETYKRGEHTNTDEQMKTGSSEVSSSTPISTV